jgi:hypothetical protein
MDKNNTYFNVILSYNDIETFYDAVNFMEHEGFLLEVEKKRLQNILNKAKNEERIKKEI